jgi:anti-anti-sigma factor
MELAHEIRDGVAVVTVSGQASHAPDRSMFHEYVKDLARDGHSLVIFDFSALSWIGSNLLGALIACYCSLRSSGGGLRIVGAGQKIIDAISLNRLSEVIPVEPSTAAAISSLWDRPSGDIPAK